MGVAETALIAKYPFLAHPVAKALLEFALKEIGQELFPVLDNFIVFTALDLNNWSQKKQYKAALEKLNAILEKEDASEKDLQDASNQMDQAFDDLFRLNR